MALIAMHSGKTAAMTSIPISLPLIRNRTKHLKVRDCPAELLNTDMPDWQRFEKS